MLFTHGLSEALNAHNAVDMALNLQCATLVTKKASPSISLSLCDMHHLGQPHPAQVFFFNMLCYRDNKDLFLMKRLVQLYGLRLFLLFISILLDKNHPPEVKVLSKMALLLRCQLARYAVSCYIECYILILIPIAKMILLNVT